MIRIRAPRLRRIAGIAVVTALALVAPPAAADFPYPRPAGDPYDYHVYMKRSPGDPLPNDWARGGQEWKYSSQTACDVYPQPPAQPVQESANCNPAMNRLDQELRGVMGASVDRAWEITTGRPDVVIAVHDSGIRWDNAGAMADLNNKTWLNRGELPVPDWGSAHPNDPYDRNADGVFNIKDYCADWDDPDLHCGGNGDSRVVQPAVGPNADYNDNKIIDPEDLIFLFSNGSDDDGNGYVDDVSGWDAFEDDNDPFDEVGYGHGTGEARDSAAEVDNGGGLAGSCPNCMVMHMRVGDSFIADVNDFAQGVVYATDNGASVIQSALGTLNNSRFAQEAIDYAYRRGVVLIASAADESAGHHNQPSVLEHAVTMNAIGEPIPPGQQPPSYLQFRGCTNYGAYITAAVPANSCSSEAVGRSAGMAGLLYAAARNAVTTEDIDDYASLPGAGAVTPGRGISAEEVDQLIGTTADDLNFTSPPYTHATSIPQSRRYGATPGWDPFFGYGRINARRAAAAIAADRIPPEADITAPRWFEIVDPDTASIPIRGRVASVRTPRYSYEIEWGLWSWGGDVGDAERNSWTPPLFTASGVEGVPDGDLSEPREGVLATIDAAAIRAAMQAQGRPPRGPAVDPATGRGDHQNQQIPDRFSIVVRIAVTAKNAAGVPVTTPFDAPDGGGDPNADRAAETPLVGMGTKVFFLHDDPALFSGFPRFLAGDGAAPPRFADLDDDGIDELIVATSNGEVHAYEAGGGEVEGWPVRTTVASLDYRAPAYGSGEITTPVHAAVLRSPAVGDLDRDGDLEVIVPDFEGRITVFDKHGNTIATMRSNPAFSSPQPEDRAAGFYDAHEELVPGRNPRPAQPLPNDPDLVPDLVNRHSKLNRLIWWFLASPSLGNIDADDDLEIIAGAGDRHLYAFEPDGEPVPGWPVLMRDPLYVDGVDPHTHEILAQSIRPRDGAKVINSVALGDVDGDDDGRLEIAAVVNEQYDEPMNSDDPALSNLGAVLQAADLIDPGNNRVYLLGRSGADRPLRDDDDPDHPHDQAYLRGWPARVGTLLLELLPVVGSGPDGAPVLGNVNGGSALELGVFGTAGPAYVFDHRGISIYGRDQQNRDRTLLTNATGSAANSQDAPAVPAVGGAIFSDIGTGELSLVAPTAGLGKLEDVALPEDQLVSDNHVSVWELQSGSRAQQTAFPREVNDLQFLSTAISADIDGDGRDEVVAGSAYHDLHAFKLDGDEPGMRALAPEGWPKFTGGWTVGSPAIGDLGGDGIRDVAHVVREGTLFVWRAGGADVCDPATWPEHGHDSWTTNNVETDAVRPRVITDLRSPTPPDLDSVALRWTAPGDDGPCGRAARYEMRRSSAPMTNENFEDAERLSGHGDPSPAGTTEDAVVRRSCSGYYVAIRTYDADPATDSPAHPANPSAVSNSYFVAPSQSDACNPAPEPSVSHTPQPGPQQTASGSPPPETTPPEPPPEETPSASPTATTRPSPGTTRSPSPSGRPTTTPASGSPSGSPASPGGPPTSDATDPRPQATTSLEADRTLAGYRRPVLLSGTVRGSCAGPREVVVERRNFGTTRFVPAARVAVPAEGVWHHEIRARRSASYVATVVSSETCEGDSSAPTDVRVRVALDRLRVRGCPENGRLSGRLRPRHPGTAVILQRRRDGRWVRAGHDEVTRSRGFRIVLPSCRDRYRVKWPRQASSNEMQTRRFTP